MSIGISTACFYPMETEKALLTLAENGIKTAEIFFNTDSELKNEFLSLLLNIKSRYDIKIAAVHPFTSICEPYLFFSEYTRRFYDVLEYYKKYFNAANLLNSKIAVFHGGYKKHHLSEELYVDRLGRLIEEADRQGVILAHENVNLHACADPDFIKMLRMRLPGIRFVMDVKQAVRAGYKPKDISREMGEAIVHVHLSDHTAGESCLLPGKGDYDFYSLFECLRNFGYKGDCMVEVYKAAYRSNTELIESARYLDRIWSAYR